ncbi:MAG: DUF1566 domain-containing protein [Candidatus Nitronauta litoralis]|uniref:DUF1566 domain-containing protein n=1 Tax=Candidatus Nitronauta litoralis TaxID=2705533 RepID=A0A7T0FZL9_9BACT|nr:MAG: DUF1566 domain-containing protein [Candidatus Nitronauta litoralis]
MLEISSKLKKTGRVVVLFASLVCVLAGQVWADGSKTGFDPGFDGQILSMTKPKAELAPSTNPRYQDNKDGSVLDLVTGVVWAKEDSYQRTRDWINWNDAQTYIKKLNKQKFGGSSSWRLPNKEELASLFDESSSIPWNYYWTTNEVHLDPIFGHSHCCYWSEEEYRKEMAWGFNYIRGRAYISSKGGIQKSLTAVRPVRDLTPEEKNKADALLAELGDAVRGPVEKKYE